VSRYQKGKTNLDFTAARDSELRYFTMTDDECHYKVFKRFLKPFPSFYRLKIIFLQRSSYNYTKRKLSKGTKNLDKLSVWHLTRAGLEKKFCLTSVKESGKVK